MDSSYILDADHQAAMWHAQGQQLQPQRPKDEVSQVTLYLDSSPERDPFSWVVEFDSRTEGVMTVPLRPPSLSYLMVKTVMIPLSYLQPFPSRYIILRIRELCIINQYYSDNHLNPQTDIVLRNNGVAGPNTYWESRNVNNFRSNVMSAVSRLTFQFLDSRGNPLTAPMDADPTAGGTGDPSVDYHHTFTTRGAPMGVPMSEGVLVELALGVVEV